MKILHIISSINLYGGTPRKIFWVVINSENKHYIFFSGDKKKDYGFSFHKKTLIDKKVEIFDPFRKKNFIKQVLYLNNLIKRNKIQIIQCNFNYDYLLGAALKVLNPNIIYIASFVGSEKPRSRLLHFLLKFCLRTSDFNIFISKYIQNSKIEAYPFLVKKHNKIIYNGVKINNISKVNKKINKGSINLLTISGLNKMKNLFILLEAVSIIVKNYKKHLTLNIIGDGPLYSDLKKAIHKLELVDIVKLLGYQNNIISFLNKSDIYVHSADKEGFGIAVVEAMSLKIPVIVSNAGALPELIVNNESGLLADPYNSLDWAEKIIYLINNKGEMERIGLNGFLRAKENFNLDRFISSYDRLYNTLSINRKL